MKDFETIRGVKAGARERLFSLPGVHAVGVGPKKIAGKSTGEHCIQVYVTKKRLLDELDPAEIIPAEIDGVKVDVVESPETRLLSVDENGYDELRGGIQIQAGGDSRGEGTLGFIAQSTDGQKIYAVTNQHVLLLTRAVSAGLDVTPTPKETPATSVKIDFNRQGFGAIDTGTVVAIRFHGVPSQQGGLKRFVVVFSTPDGAHESDVAKAINDEINATGLAVSTWQNGASFITVTPGPGLTKIAVRCSTFGTKLTESAGVDVNVSGNTIRFSGQASDPGGAYVNINVGGANPTYGLFVPIAGGDDANTVATNTVTALTAMKNSQLLHDQLLNLSVNRNGAQITIGGAEEIECQIAKDDRVGQPTNCFCCRHHKCCSNRIGLVVAVSMDMDAALIQLDGEQKYIAKVEGIPENGGAVHGTATANIGDHVQKRGRSSDLTKGTVSSVSFDAVIGLKSTSRGNPSFFHRYYMNSIRIDSEDSSDFSQGGDSGSAVMDHNNNIVGLLFGGGEGTTHGVASPIAGVLDAFKAMNVKVVVATTTDPSKAVVVPGPSFNFAALPAQHGASPIVGGEPIFDGLRKAEVEIEAIPAGKELSDVVRRHAGEGYLLVTTNKRVGAVWKRNGGQQIFPALLRLLQNPVAHLPDEIAGKPLAECLNNIRRIFERYGSPGFIADLRQWGDQVIGLMSLNYQEMLLALEGVHQPT
jgi:hypothetical protein